MSQRYCARPLERLLYDDATGPALGRDIPGAFFITLRLGMSSCWDGKTGGATFEHDPDEFVDEMFEQVDLMDMLMST